MSKASGLFVSFEGIDGSGKSTQARLLAERLRASGREVVLTREPGGSPGAEEIRKLLLTGGVDRWSPETEVLLFTAARRDHLERTILPGISRGAIVITDRFADSTRVYQGAARPDLRDIVDNLHNLMIKGEPDLTFLIDMKPRKALIRILTRLTSEADVLPSSTLSKEELLEGLSNISSNDRFEMRGETFQETLREGFLELARESPNRIKVIDGDRSEEEIAEDVVARVLARLDAR